MPIIKASICSLDNLPILKEQVEILRDDPLINEIIVVINGSIDGSREWIATQTGLTVINMEENRGASVGRNTGIDTAGKFDYILLLDGGIVPLRGSIGYMLDYLEKHPEVDVISPEIATCFSTNREEAWRRMPGPIDESTCFPQRMLSSTAYALCRFNAFDGIRFTEEGPYGKSGWKCEDNWMAFVWNEAGIIHHDFGGIKAYRKQSGSFARQYKETGVYPSQYGSVYEQALVLLWQLYPLQWNQWNT